MRGKFFYLTFVSMKAEEAKLEIDRLKSAGIQHSALAKQMGMSDKVFSTRRSEGNWTEDELKKLQKLIKKYPK